MNNGQSAGKPATSALNFVAAGVHRAFALICFVIVAAGVVSFVKFGFGWFEVSVICFFLVKGTFAWFFARRRSGKHHPGTLLAPGEWRAVAIGYLAVATLFLTSALVGDNRLISALGVATCVTLGISLFRISAGVFREKTAA